MTSFCHAHRTGRLGVDEDELADLVGRWVVRAVGGEADLTGEPERTSEADRVSEAGRTSEPDGESSQVGEVPDLTVRLLPTGSRQRVRVAQTSQPSAPKGISAR